MNTPGIQEAQGFNHGSAANNGPLGVSVGPPVHTHAMVPTTHVAAPAAPVAMDSSGSEDSLTFSPPKKRAPARSVPGTLKRRGRDPGQAARRPASLPRPPSRRTTQRAPSPAIRDASARPDAHQVFVAGGPSADERLAALEQQQKVDHEYFVRIRETLEQLQRDAVHRDGKVKDVEANQNNHLQVGVQIRRELYGVRDNLQGELNKVNLVLQDTVQQKFTALDAQVNVLQGHVESAKAMEAKFTTYLNSLEEQRPQEGKTLTEAFQAVSSEVNRVKQMVGQIEQPNMNVFQHQVNGVVTKDMVDALRWIQSKVMNHDMQFTSLPELITRMTTYSATVDALGASFAGFTTRLADMEQYNAAAGPSAGTPSQGTGAGAPGYCPPGFGNPPLFVPGACGGGACGGGCGGGATAMTGQPSGGSCHCLHLDQLDVRVQALEQWRRQARTQDPWHGPRAEGEQGGSDPPGRPSAPRASPERDHGGPGRGECDPQARKELPLKLYGNLGAVAFKDRSIFDEKFTLQEEYRFNGVKNGDHWKVKVERYFIARAPVLKEILEFAEREDMEEVTFERFRAAAGHALTEEQMQTVNAGIWGFLAACLTGSAEALFERADMLNGLDAWRRVVRHIDHGREIHLETLRREMKSIHNRPIRDIHGVEEGIANFENTMYRYIRAGGSHMRDAEKKSDLLQILPETIRRDLVWHATNGDSFEHFRDHVLAQSQKIILHTRRGINAVDDENRRGQQDTGEGGEGPDLEEMMAAIGRGDIPQMGQLVAAVGRFVKGKKNFPPRQPRADGRQAGGEEAKRNRAPRKCPNCNQEHESRICPYPSIDRSARKCWICEQVGHQSNACPNKKKAPIKAIEDTPGAAIPFFGVGMVADEQGFQKVRGGARPMPSQAKLHDFVSSNSFEAFGINSVTTTQGQRKRARRVAAAQTPAGHEETSQQAPTASVDRAQVPATSAAPTEPIDEPPPAAHQEVRRPRARRGHIKFAACHDADCGGCQAEPLPVSPKPLEMPLDDAGTEITKDVSCEQLEKHLMNAMDETIKEAEHLMKEMNEHGSPEDTTTRSGILINTQVNR